MPFMTSRFRRVRATRVAAIAALSMLVATAARATDHPGQAPFEQYCASCHGQAADGQGPMAEQLKKKPEDLRKLHQVFGSPLAKPRLREVIDGRDMPRAHGTSDMPVWGEKLLASVPPTPDGKEFFKRGTIFVIIDYLETLQVK